MLCMSDWLLNPSDEDYVNKMMMMMMLMVMMMVTMVIMTDDEDDLQEDKYFMLCMGSVFVLWLKTTW